MINEAGLKLLCEFEGLRLQAYLDEGNVPTVGYGSTHNVVMGLVITKEEALRRLRLDCEDAEKGVRRYVTQPLNENQLSALICFVYNVGAGNLARSTLLNSINHNEWQAAADAFLPWCKISGVPSEGLERRRQAERTLFMTPVETIKQNP